MKQRSHQIALFFAIVATFLIAPSIPTNAIAEDSKVQVNFLSDEGVEKTVVYTGPKESASAFEKALENQLPKEASRKAADLGAKVDDISKKYDFQVAERRRICNADHCKQMRCDYGVGGIDRRECNLPLCGSARARLAFATREECNIPIQSSCLLELCFQGGCFCPIRN